MKIRIYFSFRSAEKFITLAMVIFSVLCSNNTSAQKNSEAYKFDSIYFETAVNISAKDINKAIHIADSLYQYSDQEIHRLKALMLSSSLLQQKGEIKRSVHYAVKADGIAVKHKFYDWEARIAGFLSTQYRLMGLYEEGERYLEKGRTVSNKIENDQIKTLYLGMIYQETAYYEMEYENFKAAYTATKRADNYFNRIQDELNKNYFLATNQELFGRICIQLEKWDDAFTHYNEALSRLALVTQENALLSAFIYSGLGRIYLERNDMNAAFENLQKAEEIVQQSDYLNLKIELYKTLAMYYRTSGDYSKYSIYNEKYVESIELSEKKKKESITDFVNSARQSGKVQEHNKNMLLITSVSLSLIVILTLIFQIRRRKRDFKRFKEVMNRMKQNQHQKESALTPTSGKEEEKQEEQHELQEEEKQADKKKIMSDAVEAKILKDLKEFEKGTRYTDKQISLSILAGMFNTNTKYLSYVLNTHKNKDFNTYINELRVKYIIEKVEKNNTFRNYKLSALAEECGFSSHSKFSAVFKSVTGFPPSVFFEYLEKSKQE